MRTQNPAAGSSARVGSTVSLTIGAGSMTAVVDVPSVIGLPSKDAVARLVAAGFVTELVRAPVPEGAFAGTDIVVAQSPVGRFGRDQAGVVRVYVPTR